MTFTTRFGRHALVPTLTASLLVACSRAPETDPVVANVNPVETAAAAPGWRIVKSGGMTLALYGEGGTPVIRLVCPAGRNQLKVNVPGFRPIGSEERLSLGSAGTVVALVADTAGDRELGGVTATGPVPDEVKAIAQGPMSVSYGAQVSGPHPVAPDELARDFVTACYANATAEREAAARPNADTHPCRVQGDQLLRGPEYRAVGTEPFWAARIVGRCVTYSTPDNQAGTRIWTQINTGPIGAVFVGALGGKPFILRTDPTRQCSDGMSDKTYPITVELTVGGEGRRGCAEPAN